MKKLTVFLICLCLLQVTALCQQENCKNILKVEPFSIFTGNITLGYEKRINPYFGWDFYLGLAGIQMPYHKFDERGIFLSTGPKYTLRPDLSTPNCVGWYVRPELTIGRFEKRTVSDGKVEDKPEYFGALILQYGREQLLWQSLCVDWHFGVGFSLSQNDSMGYWYRFIRVNDEIPLSFSAGLSIGLHEW